MRGLTSLIIVSTGAFFYWFLGGFKTKFNEQMSGQYDRDAKYFKNLLTGVVIYTIIFSIIIKVLT